MANDLSARRKSLGNTRQASLAKLIWIVGIPLLSGLAILILLSRRQGSSTGFVHSTTKAQVQVSNCTQAAPAGVNVSCNCPPTPIIPDGASADKVLRLANKVSSTTVENILDAASTNEPSEKTVRVCWKLHSSSFLNFLRASCGSQSCICTCQLFDTYSMYFICNRLKLNMNIIMSSLQALP